MRVLDQCCVVLLVVAGCVPAQASDQFKRQVQPFLKVFCQDCHNSQTAEAALNLAAESAAETFATEFRKWETVITFVERREMPPATAPQPTEAERTRLLMTLRTLLAEEARKTAGDPGIVPPRRLSNAEYNHTIRDLTGYDLRPAASFPVDPSAGEGFNNTGEALLMSPTLFKKYYAAAQSIADHVDFTPGGWRFAPYPVPTYADQKKYHEQAVLDFYASHDVQYEAYLTAAWRYRALANDPAEFAKTQGLSPRYFVTFWNLISGPSAEAAFYVRWIRDRWAAIPAAASVTAPVPPEVQAELKRFANDLYSLGKQLCPIETEAIVSHAGNAPIQHIERRQKTAHERDSFRASLIVPSRRLRLDFKDLQKREAVELVLHVPATPDGLGGFVILDELNFTASPQNYKPVDNANRALKEILAAANVEGQAALTFGQHPKSGETTSTRLVLPAGTTMTLRIPTILLGNSNSMTLFADAMLDREHTPGGLATVALLDHIPDGHSLSERPFPLVDPDHPVANALRESCESVCRVIPNRFAAIDDTRGLSAGFHLIEGFFRDDVPLCRHVLTDDENKELDRLWDELEFGTQIAEKMLRGFVFFERSERNFMKHADFDSFKEEDPRLVTPESVSRLEEAYFTRSGGTRPGEARETHPIHQFFEGIRRGLIRRAEQLKAAEPVYQQQLEAFAEAAFRRPLSESQRAQLRAFYTRLKDQPEVGTERAVRAAIVWTLVSPSFCYRADPAAAGTGIVPRDSFAIASRLSYFLWSSAPDAELRIAAQKGQLHDEEVLRAQTRRMLQDPRVAGLAEEFFGQWLRYRDFLEQESVSRESFPGFDDELRQAMYEEPTRLATALLQQNRSVLELLTGDSTFVNKRLAEHYGLPQPLGGAGWHEVSGLHAQGRSGMLGMAVFLTKNSQPQRTSPVKRGFWVIHHVLGEHIPAPPPDVVALPAREVEGEQTVRQLLASHVSDPKCARCHVRFDGIGLAMEGFDATGRVRSRDLAGRPIDSVVELPNGTRVRGIAEYSQFLATSRTDDFQRTLCRKLLGYALGRSLLLSDLPLLETMQSTLQREGFRFGPLLEVIVLSPQFRMQRGRDYPAGPALSQAPGD